MFRQPYDNKYTSSDYATDVGYDSNSDPAVQLQNALEASKTEQSHLASTDVNLIMSRFAETGVLPQGNGQSLSFGDLSDAPTYLEALIVVADANEAFAQLPSEIRERFVNDPRKFLAFMDDEKNFDEAVKLGLVKPLPAPIAPEAAPLAENTPAA